MAWLSSLFRKKQPVPKTNETPISATYFAEAIRDSEEPLLNKVEAADAVKEFYKTGAVNRVPFWNFLRQYKAQLRKATVEPASCCGGLSDDGGIVEDITITAINVASAIRESTNDTPVSTPTYEPPTETSSWSSDNSTSSYDSGGSDGGGGGDCGGGGGD